MSRSRSQSRSRSPSIISVRRRKPGEIIIHKDPVVIDGPLLSERIRQIPGPPKPRQRPPRDKKPPQQSINEHWAAFNSKFPGKITSVLPSSYHLNRLSHRPDADEGLHNAVESYAEAARICTEKVAKIVGECKRINQKYRDPHVDIETDFYRNTFPECLKGMLEKKNDPKLEPKSVKRVADIFTDPKFFIQGASANDVKQGRNGDCWLMSALCTVSNCPGLIERICVARDEQVGVYGFVFQRDGSWISEVVDDKLFLIKEDFYDHDGAMDSWLELQDSKDTEKEYKKRFQTGSKALYFAQCTNPNETWLPLLEKAFAKAHGDYLAVEGGFVGEAIEDLTGGVTSEIHSTDILDKDAFWTNELLQVNKLFLFGCGQSRGVDLDRKGIQHRHAYSIMEAREIDGIRLLKLRNPWAKGEWNGAWADGSEEWTPYWMQALNHKFGDDGVFWISYEDLLNAYQHFDRTRLFDETWNVTQTWLSVNVPWSSEYQGTCVALTVSKSGSVVFVFSQLDDRYFRGLEGQYTFRLQFRLHKRGDAEYFVRSPSSYNMHRSVSTEVHLEPGSYTVKLKVIATFNPWKMPVDEVIYTASRVRREKLMALGLSHDLAHAKAQVLDNDKGATEEQTRTRRRKRKEEARSSHEAARKGRAKAKAIAKSRSERLEAKRKPVHGSEAGRDYTFVDPREELVPRREANADHADKHAHTVAKNPVVREMAEVIVGQGEPAPESEIVADARSNIESAQEQEHVGVPASIANGAETGDLKTGQETTQQEAEQNSSAIVLNEGPPLQPANGEAEDGAARNLPDRTAPGGDIAYQHEDRTGGQHPRGGFPDLPPNRSTFPPRRPWEPRRRPFPGLPDHLMYEHVASYDEIEDGDLSWDSELDAPPDTDDERVIPMMPARERPTELLPEESVGEPWNAVCVVGLRVYAHADNEIGLRIVRAGRGQDELCEPDAVSAC